MSADNAATTEETITVEGMTCGHCKQTVEGALQALDGVTSAEVDLDARTVAVRYDAPVTRATVVGAIEAQGYAVPA